MMILMLPTIHGCASLGAGADVWCQTNDPRRPTEVEYEAMDRQSREDMRTHNAYGAARCGWRA